MTYMSPLVKVIDDNFNVVAAAQHLALRARAINLVKRRISASSKCSENRRNRWEFVDNLVEGAVIDPILKDFKVNIVLV